MKTKTGINKLTTYLLAFAMLIASVICTSVYASAEEHTHTDWTPITKLSEITAAGNYYIADGFTLGYYDREIDADGVVNICLNGQSIEYGSAISLKNATVNIYDCGKSSFKAKIENYGTLNLYSGTIGKSITNKENAALNIYGGTVTATVVNSANATLNIYDGLISNTAGDAVDNRGTLIINGGTLESESNRCVYHRSGTAQISGNPLFTSKGSYATVDICADMTISGGTFTSETTSPVLYTTGGSPVVTVSGGTFTGTGNTVICNIGTINIEDGTFKGGAGQYVLRSSTNLNVSGGTFSTEDGEAYLYVYRASDTDAPISLTGGVFKNGIKIDYYKNNGYGTAYLADILEDGYAYYQNEEVLILENQYVSRVTGGDVTVAAEPDVETYTITFDANGGTVSTTSATTNLKCMLKSLPTPSRDNYDFIGWFDAAEGGAKITVDTVYSESKTIYAQWTPKTYTITYVLYDGKTDVDTYTYGEDVDLPDDAEREGYRFCGWYKDEAYTFGPFGKIEQGGIDFRFYAKWSPEYTVTIVNPENGSIYVDIIEPIEDERVTVTVDPDDGYDLGSISVEDANGDSLELSGDGYEHTFKMPAGNVTVSAVFERARVSFNSNGGTGIMESVVVTDTNGTYTLPACDFIAPDTSVPGGMDFKGWALSKDGEVIVDSTITVTKNTELFAIWKYTPELEHTIQKSGIFKESHTFDIDVGALLPPDAKIMAGLSVSSGGVAVEKATPNIVTDSSDASLKIVTRVADVPLSDFVTMTIKTSNYGEFKITVKVDLISFEIKAYDSSAKTASVWFEETGTYKVVFADYENNRLANLDIAEVVVEESELGIVTVEMNEEKNFVLGTGDKIMLWGDLVNLVPKCEAYILP